MWLLVPAAPAVARLRTQGAAPQGYLRAGLSPHLEAVSPRKPEQGSWPLFTPISDQAGVA